MTPAIQGHTFLGKHGTSFLLQCLRRILEPQQPHQYNENTVFYHYEEVLQQSALVKEVVRAVVANFPGELRRLTAKSNLRVPEQQLQAH